MRQYSGSLYVTSNLKVADILLDNPHLILMLEHFGLGLAVHDLTIEQICKERDIDSVLFVTLANLYNGHASTRPVTGSTRIIASIVDYLQKNHDYYLFEKLPSIQRLIQQMYKENAHSEMVMVEQFFQEYSNEVVEHLNYESQVVFPYIRHLCNPNDVATHRQSDYSMEVFKGHHSDIEEKLTDLKNLLVKYLPLHNDGRIRRNLLLSLFELEYDLHIHTRVEDSILTPLVEALEKP